MYNAQLEKMIEIALMDGELTEKEKQILFKKAEAFGVDLDEFEMLLDTKIKSFKGKTLKEKMIKCPNCGESISGLVNVCPACNYVIEDKGGNSKINLQDLVLGIEENLKELKSIPHPNFFKTVQEQIQYFLILLGIIFFFLALKIGTTDLGYGFMILAGIFGFAGIVNVLRKISEKVKAKEKATFVDITTNPTFKEVKADFEKNSRLANTYFGEDKKVKGLLSDLKTEITTIEHQREKSKKTNMIVYLVLGLIALSTFLIPKQKSNWEKQEEEASQKANQMNEALKNKHFTLDNNKITTSGNIGKCLAINSEKIPIQVEAIENYSNVGYALSITIKFKVNSENTNKMKKERLNIIKDCYGGTIDRCGEISANLSFEDENRNAIGIESLKLSYDQEDILEKALDSESDEFSLEFTGSINEPEIDKLAKVKNSTISIILSKK
jgi:hypothetical protein